MTIGQIRKLLTLSGLSSFVVLNTVWHVEVYFDQKALPKMGIQARLYMQVIYGTACKLTGMYKQWKGRKWYLSEYMTEDEIIKTAFAAFKMAVEHEVLEGFQINGKSLFNPHVDYKELLKISDKEITREEKKDVERKSSVTKLPGRKQRQSVSGGHGTIKRRK